MARGEPPRLCGMGRASRARERREAIERAHIASRVYGPSVLAFAEIEEIASEDPDDRAIREAHGLGRDDTDDTVCRFGWARRTGRSARARCAYAQVPQAPAHRICGMNPDVPMNVNKHASTVSISEQLLTEDPRAGQALIRALDRALSATPAQRAEWAAQYEQRQREMGQERARVRAETPHVPLILDALIEKMGWSRAYAEHLVQPYCECGTDGADGEWQACRHALDEGVTWS